MGLSNKFSALAIACSIALVGCGGSGGESEDVLGGPVNAGDTANPSDVATDPDMELAPVEATGSFFNATDGVRFASSLGENLSSILASALGATSGGGGSATGADVVARTTREDFVEPCDSGSISSSFNSDASGEVGVSSIVFNNCTFDGQTSTGSISIQSSASGNSENLVLEFADFGSTGPQGDSFIDGDINVAISDDLSSSISGTQLTMTADGETTVFSNFELTTASDDVSGNSTVGGMATIASTTDGTIEFSLIPAFSGPADGFPTVGTLNLSHSDGSFLIIDANTGDPDTYSYTVSGDGSVTSGEGRWDEEGFDIPSLGLE